MSDNRLEVFDLPGGGKQARVRLYDDKEGLSSAEVELITGAIDLLVEGGQNIGVGIGSSDSRALVVRAAISQWIKATKKIASESAK